MESQNPLITEICKLREETIAKHFAAAMEEIKSKVQAEPLKTIFEIYAGCVSKEVGAELAYRLTVGNGYTATVCTSGLISSSYYLEVKMSLPESLVHAKPVEVKIVDVAEQSEQK